MTKKKYTIGDYTNCRYNICEILKDGEFFCVVGTDYVENIITILEENEQLKQKVDFYKDFQKDARELEKENEQLKLEYKELRYANNIYCGVIDKLKKRNNELEKENEQLKSENEELQHQINYLENRLDDCVCLKKENKDLKSENLELSQSILKGLFEDENKELRKENKKLKEELQWCRMTVDGLKGDVE